jgi:hypothetical protein
MATAIEHTPTLKGKSSRRFNEQLSADEKNKVSPADKKRITQLVEKILKKSHSK